MFGSWAFTVVPVIVALVFLTVFAAIVVAIVKGLRLRARNNASPVETLRAAVVAKRANVSGGMGDTSSSTSYHVTFELLEGERVELGVSGAEYGQLAEGDRGMLTRQGTRYQGFVRDLTGRAL